MPSKDFSMMKNKDHYTKNRQAIAIWKRIGSFSDIPCSKCGQMGKIFIEEYDDWACIYCNEWYSEPCSNPKYPFCSTRPDTPYEVYWKAKDMPPDAASIKRWRQDNYSHKEKGRLRHEKLREE